MSSTLVHRGPDDAGEWSDPAAGVALGFRRLSILDLSVEGHQPMTSASGRYVIVFNGEAYNFAQIRRELENEGRAPRFRGHSDTEVLLAAFEAWGIEAAVRRIVGMFAFAVWDREHRRLHLVRDRIGVKPLYYGHAGTAVVFGSEVKALRVYDGFDATIDRDALASFFRYNYIPAPRSIYRQVRKVMPGTIVTIDGATGREISTSPYWSAREVAERGMANPFRGSAAEAVERLHDLLADSIGLRMIADVPLGVFLSGGIDSSTVVAIMQAQSSRPVKSFSIGFREESFDEAQHAAAVARHLGTDHTELYVTAAEAIAAIPSMPGIYDEPFSDSSQIPTYLVSRLARRDVTVSLSGDGGDELFGGYNRYSWARRVWRQLRWTPAPLRRMVARGLTSINTGTWDTLFGTAAPLLPRAIRQKNAGDKIHKLASIIEADSADGMYLTLCSHWGAPGDLVRNGKELSFPERTLPEGADFTQRMMYLDLVSYLPDDIMVKVDRASMAVSLEAREPLLDHRLVEFAWTLPMEMKVRGGVGKWLLRQVLYRQVPERLMDRPKMGFGVPIAEWLRGPLRDWAEGLLDARNLAGGGLLNPEPVRKLWSEHLSGRRNWQYHLWDVLMFQSWFEASLRADERATYDAEPRARAGARA